MTHIDIFISSPSDLLPERLALKHAIERLNDDMDIAGKFYLHVFLWEVEVHEEDLQGYDWQQYINLFGQHLTTSHIVVGMLWGRLGQELRNFVNPVTGRPYRSGTEYELSTAADAERQHGSPRVLFYQCNRTVPLLPLDDVQAVESRTQMRLVQQFVQEMLDEGMISHPIATFGGTEDLASQALRDIKAILPEIEQRLLHGKPEISTLPALPYDYVPREHDLAPIVTAIRTNRITLLHGLPGQGKTVIARAACERIAAAFPGGVLWATFGQRSDLARIQREWILQLHGDLSRAYDVQNAHEELLRCLQGKQALLVFDDVWRADDAYSAANAVPESCHILVTSRNASLLPHATTLELGPMTPTDSRELLRQASKHHLVDAVQLDEIAARLGYLALALKVVGARLVQYSWPDIREQLAGARFASLETGQRNVYAAMDASVRFLPDDQQQRYRELVIFPRGETLSATAVFRLWQATAGLSFDASQYLLTLFQSLSLIQADMGLHDLQLDYLAALTDPHAQRQLQHTFTSTFGAPAAWSALPDDYAWRWFAWHVAQAGRTNDLRDLLLNATYLQNKITHISAASVASDMALLPADPTLKQLGKTIALGRRILDAAPQELRNQVVGRARSACYDQMHDWPAVSAPHFSLETQTLNQAGSDQVFIMPHSGKVRLCAFSPNYRYAMSSSDPATVTLWDLETGEVRHTLEGHDIAVNACQFSPDGNFAVTASSDSTLRTWDVTSGECLHVFRGHHDRVFTCSYSPDGNEVVSGSADGTLRLWDTATGRSLRVFEGHENMVRFGAFASEGRLVISASNDHTIRFWETKTGQCIQVLRGHDDIVLDCALDLSKTLLLSASGDETLRLWDIQTGQCIRVFNGHRGLVAYCDFVPGGKYIASAALDFTLRVWDMASGDCLHTLESKTTTCAVSPNGNYVLSNLNDRSIQVWDVETGAPKMSLRGHGDYINALEFNADGRYLLSGGEDQTLRMWDLSMPDNRQERRGHSADALVSACTFSPDGRYLLTADMVGTLCLWEVASGNCVHVFDSHAEWVKACAFSPDGLLVLSGSNDRTLRIWDAASGECRHVLKGHRYGVQACAFSPDGRLALSAGRDGSLRLWDATSGQCMFIMEIPSAGYLSVDTCAFNPSGQIILSGSSDGSLRLWDVATGQIISTLLGHSGSVNDCKFSPDGSLILSVAQDSIRLWNAATGECRHEFLGFPGGLAVGMFSPDGQLALGPGGEGLKTLLLWDVHSGELRHTLQGPHDGIPLEYVFSPNSEYVLSSSSEQTLQLWDLSGDREIASWITDGAFVSSLDISRDGAYVGAGDNQGNVHIFKVDGVALG